MNGEIDQYIENLIHDPRNIANIRELNQQAKAAMKTFGRSDIDKNGNLSIDEIVRLTETMGLPITNYDEFLVEMDKDDDGAVDETEFVKWWLARVSRSPSSRNQQEIFARNTFKRLDIDNSGSLSTQEFGSLMSELGADFSAEELILAIAELDCDRSGTIDQEEFVSWWAHRNASIRKGGGLMAIKMKKLANKAAKMFATDIFTACWNNNLDLVRMFLDSDARLCDSTDPTEMSEQMGPLHYASYRGHIDIVQELLNQRAKVDLGNQFGFTPLFFAAQQGHVVICDKLISAGGNPSVCGANPDYPDISLCPVDFVNDFSDLGEIFSRHKSYFSPKSCDPKFWSTEVTISDSGALLISLRSTANISIGAITELPIRSWDIEFVTDSNDRASTLTSLKIKTSTGLNVKQCRLEVSYQFQDPKLFRKVMQSLTSRNLFARLKLSNSAGAGDWSDSVQVGHADPSPPSDDAKSTRDTDSRSVRGSTSGA